MRRVEYTKSFKRDYKKHVNLHSTLDTAWFDIIGKLIHDESLPANYCDHALTGNYMGFRDCHIKPDLVLIYCKPDPETLQLVRLGSHSELDL